MPITIAPNFHFPFNPEAEILLSATGEKYTYTSVSPPFYIRLAISFGSPNFWLCKTSRGIPETHYREGNRPMRFGPAFSFPGSTDYEQVSGCFAMT